MENPWKIKLLAPFCHGGTAFHFLFCLRCYPTPGNSESAYIYTYRQYRIHEDHERNNEKNKSIYLYTYIKNGFFGDGPKIPTCWHPSWYTNFLNKCSQVSFQLTS